MIPKNKSGAKPTTKDVAATVADKKDAYEKSHAKAVKAMQKKRVNATRGK